MKALFIAWQDPETRLWHTIGRLNRDPEGYSFAYTHGAERSPRFSYLGRMMDLRNTYYSEELFPLFENRLLDESRPEYPKYLNWLGLSAGADKIELLARSGGIRGTDSLCVYPDVMADENGNVVFYFFSHGLRYLEEYDIDSVDSLVVGSPLDLKAEIDNKHDRYALIIETQEQTRAGYCPRYLNEGLNALRNRTQIKVEVERINLDAPLQFKLLCKASFRCPDGFRLFDTTEHSPYLMDSKAA